MRNEKGFTMLELLAVIVVVAVVTLLSMPIILKLINDVKEESSKNAAYATMYAISSEIKSDLDLEKPVACNEFNGTYVVCKDSKEESAELLVTIRTSKIDSIDLTYKSDKISGSIVINGYEWNVTEDGLEFEK